MFRLLSALLLSCLSLWCAACSPDPRKEADKLFDAMDYAGAIKGYAPLIANKNAHLEVRRRYALSLARVGRAADAEPLLATILQTSPDPEVASAEIDCLALVKGLEDAWKLGQDLLRKYPEAATVHRAVGTLAAQRGDTASAVMHLERALVLEPKLAAAHANLGDLRLKEGDVVGAMERYQRAVESEPRSPMSVRTRVRMAQVVGDARPDQAMAVLQEAVAIDPSSPEVEAELGKLLAGQGLYEESIQYLKAAYEQKLERTDILSTLGYSFLQKAMSNPDPGLQHQDLLAARMWLNRLLTKDPAYRGAHNNLGKTLAKLGDTEQAELAFRQELNLFPSSVEALTNLGRYLADQGQADKAKELLTRAFELDRSQVMLAGELGRMALLQGDWDGGLSWYETAYRLCQESAPDHRCRIDVPFQLARIAGHRKNKEAAVQFFQKAMEAGFTDVNRFKAEDDLRIIQTDPRVAPFLAAIPQ